MADEIGDIDVDVPIGSGGGYVDDDIDVDMDDDDDELVPLGSRATGSSADAGGSKKMRTARGGTITKRDPAAEAAAEFAPRDTDLLLRPGSKRGRELILARFLGKMPELADASRVRLYRAREGTVDGRTRGLKAHQVQQAYYNSYVGRQRLSRYARTGHHAVPDRARKGWTLEITPEGMTPSEPPPPPMRGQPATYPPEATVYSGAFDGAHTASRYALMVMGADGRYVDVVPVGDNAWYSFRSVRAGGVQSSEEALAIMNRLAKRGEKRIAKFESRSEEAHERRESMMGGYSRFEEKHAIAPIGIRRKVNLKREAENLRAGEAFDFEEEFANDDVLQVDHEDAVKEQRSRQPPRDHKKEAELFRKLIKDEIKPADASSQQSDSEEEDGTKSPSRSPSPSRPLSQSRAMSPSSQLPPTAPRQPGASSGSASKNAAAGSARTSRAPSRAGTPQLQEVAHLLPPKGTLPSEQHVTAVLRALTVDRGRARIKLRDLLSYFERNQEAQKTNLTRLIKVCGQIVMEEVGKTRVYFISPKPS